MDQVKSRNDWSFCNFNQGSIIKDKSALINQYIRYMLDRTQQIFEYNGLPSTISKKDLENLLQINGYACITKINDDLYAFYGALGGTPNAYYLPTKCVVSNPYLKFNKELTIDDDCVLMLNDSMYIGLMPMFNKYAELLAETDISIRLASINARITNMIVADDDSAFESAEEFLLKLENGQLGAIASDGFFEGFKTQEYGSRTNNNIKDLIELQQYLKSNWYIDLGLNANYNMKRESINESESAMNDDCLLPLIDNMLEQRKKAILKINEKYGTNISVKLASSWDIVRKEIKLADDILQSQIEKGDNNE